MYRWATSERRRAGFTIVELLIVIVVIAILAAITIVAFNGIQDNARASSVQNDLASAKKKLLLYKADNDVFPNNSIKLIDAGIRAGRTAYDVSTNNFYYCYNLTTDQFAIGARTISNKAAYIITSTSSLQKVANVDGSTTCQAIGLTAWNDPNAMVTNGHTSGTGWLSWVIN